MEGPLFDFHKDPQRCFTMVNGHARTISTLIYFPALEAHLQYLSPIIELRYEKLTLTDTTRLTVGGDT